MKILVTGANSTVAHSILKGLRASGLPAETFGCDINPYSPGLYRVDHAFLVKPFTDPAYEAQMLSILREHRIDLLLPAVEGELQSLADRKEAWERETGCRILVNSREVLDITQDKYETARFLGARGCRVPDSAIIPEEIAALIERVGFPLIVKPRRGATSKHVYQVQTPEELWARFSEVPNPVVQEYLPGEEYTCGVFVDAQGTLKGIATIQRTLANGITMTALVDSFPEVEAEVRRVVEAVRPIASCNIQLRSDREGKPTTVEINARFSSSVAIRAHFGFNEVEATLRSFLLHEAVPPMHCRPGVAMRYVNEVYIEKEECQHLLTRGHHLPR
ncbi:MAG: ATP-grasp domain-containing protein, partial [Bacteroidota bacterium]